MNTSRDATRGIAAARRFLRGGSPAAWTAERSRLAGLLLAVPLIVLLAVMLVLPLERLISIALGAPKGLGNLGAFFESDANVRVIRITFIDSAIVTALCVILGWIYAWALLHVRSRGTELTLWAALALPFLMGTVVKLFALTTMLSSQGVINRALMELGVTNEPLELLYNQFAVIVGMIYQMLPFAVIPLLASFRRIDTDLVQAAEGLGAGRLRAIFSTVVPLSLPSVLASATLVYIISVGFFLTPVLLGGATAPFTASLIASDLFEFYDVTSAAVSALVLLAGSLLVVGVAWAIVGRDRLLKATAT